MNANMTSKSGEQKDIQFYSANLPERFQYFRMLRNGLQLASFIIFNRIKTSIKWYCPQPIEGFIASPKCRCIPTIKNGGIKSFVNPGSGAQNEILYQRLTSNHEYERWFHAAMFCMGTLLCEFPGRPIYNTGIYGTIKHLTCIDGHYLCEPCQVYINYCT